MNQVDCLKTISYLDWRTLFEARESDLSPVEIQVLDHYFSCFVQPEIQDRNGKKVAYQACVQCGVPVIPPTPQVPIGYRPNPHFPDFGNCSNCNWPARANHIIPTLDRKDILFGISDMPLQYHPLHVFSIKPSEMLYN